MRSRIFVGWMYSDATPPVHMELVFPAVVMMGHVTSSCVWDSLWGQHWHSGVTRFISAMRQISKVHFSVREPDSAEVCLKTCAYEAHCQATSSLHSTHVCSLHQFNMSCGAVVETAHDKTLRGGENLGPILQAVSGCAKLLKMGNHSLRVVLAVEAVFGNRRQTHIVKEPPSSKHLEEWRNLRLLFSPMSTRPPPEPLPPPPPAVDSETGPRRRKRSKQAAAKQRALETGYQHRVRFQEKLAKAQQLHTRMFNGDPFAATAIHHCGFGCDCQTETHSIELMSTAYSQTALGFDKRCQKNI